MSKPQNQSTRKPEYPKIAFFGTPRLAQIVLERLVNTPYKPQLVITAPDAKVGRGRKIQFSSVKQTALKHKIKILQPSNLNQQSTINNQQFDLAILVAYGKILPKKVLSVPKFGFVNIHPSLLPKYRGPSPVQSAILAGDKKTGISIIRLDEEVDHGPVFTKREIAIKNNDTHASLNEKLAKIGAEELIKILPDYLDGEIKSKPQNHKEATFTKHISKQDGQIDLSNPPDPKTLDRMTRAYHPWPGVWTELKWKVESGKWKVMKIKFIPNTKYKIPDTILIQPEGKQSMTIKEFLNGYPQVKELLEKLF